MATVPSLSSMARNISGPIAPGLLPSFLVPACLSFSPVLRHSRHHHLFSTSARYDIPKKLRDMNRSRGVSALRRSPPKHGLYLAGEPLPKPVIDASKRSKVKVDPDHGLWQFFNKKRTRLSTPEEDDSHGRAWAHAELRLKSWADLHRLWWVCVKERNRLATQKLDRDRLKAGYGEFEGNERDKEVKLTMKRIRGVLLERSYAWTDAWELAKQDRNIRIDANGIVDLTQEISLTEDLTHEETMSEDHDSNPSIQEPGRKALAQDQESKSA